MTEKPHRRFQLHLDLEGDDLAALAHSLEQIAFDVHNGSRGSVSGGVDAGYHWTLAENADMTHDKYVDAVNVYLGKAKS